MSSNSLRIAYIGVVCDFFHYGHLKSIQFAASVADITVCGVYTNKVVEKYRVKPFANLKERLAVVKSLRDVDQVVVQTNRNPTENLKKLHNKYPRAEIILVHGDDLSIILGEDYVKKIGGRVIKHVYYKRLSNFKMISYLVKNQNEFKDIKPFTSYIKESDGKKNDVIDNNKVIISSKADTLFALKRLLKRSRIEPMVRFSVSDWRNNSHSVLARVKRVMKGKAVIIRSSAVQEDTLDKSMAGYFDSVPNISSTDLNEITIAIEKVIDSYRRGNAETSFNQIMVQKQTKNIAMSGVAFTRTINANGPYYEINYDDTSGSSDTVTSGREGKLIKISRFAGNIPAKFKKLILSIKEIEGLIPAVPLDVEYAVQKNGDIVIFQVRPLVAVLNKGRKDKEVSSRITGLKEKLEYLSQPISHLAGKTTFFGDMPDWNPAEIIGNNPNLLDYSLYDYLITAKAWHSARTSQYYYNVSPAKLVELFGIKPFVNMRNSFNSFIPADISDGLREKLVDYYLHKIQKKPYLQDKVEFEVLFTCYDLNFGSRARELFGAGFSHREIMQLRESLLTLTNRLVNESDESIDRDLASVSQLNVLRETILNSCSVNSTSAAKLIDSSRRLLDDCRKYGTVQFSRLARLGFIGKILLQSLITRKIVDRSFFDAFYESINTVAADINHDFMKLVNEKQTQEEFIKKYYHLRPGTYDITSLRYDANPNLISAVRLDTIEKVAVRPELDKVLEKAMTTVLRSEGLQLSAEQLLNFVERATIARELSKFEFTKNLSDALELVAMAGEKMGFTRCEMAMLDVNDILSAYKDGSGDKDVAVMWKALIKINEAKRSVDEMISLPSIIFSVEDFDVIQNYEAKPNFITNKKVQSKVVNISHIEDKNVPDLTGRIVVLENGDPGYDWIFTRNPAGLVTKFGGVASHMSIRCAEFGIPAAIGCGEEIYNKIHNANNILLDCNASKIVRID